MINKSVFDVSRRIAFPVVGLAAIVVLAACGQSAGNPPASGAMPPSSSNVSPSPKATSPKASPKASSPKKNMFKTSSPKAAQPSDTLTGFGSTIGAWNAHHTADTKYTPGSVYDPDPALPPTGGAQADYIAVTPECGRVTNYTINVARLAINAAIARAQQELPSDARKIWGARKGTCYQAELTSSTLGNALASGSFGDPEGDVFVEFDTVLSDGSSVYKSTDINEIIMSLGSYPADTSTAC